VIFSPEVLASAVLSRFRLLEVSNKGSVDRNRIYFPSMLAKSGPKMARSKNPKNKKGSR